MNNDNKPDFTNVRSQVASTEQAKPDFSNVRSEVVSSEPIDDIPAATTQTYVVEKGDTLSAIAQRVYGQASAWKRIFDANRDLLDDPDLIKPGQTLKLPAIEQ